MHRAGSDLAEAGRAAADRLWHDGQKAAIDDPLQPEFAQAAVAQFALLQRRHTPGILRDALEGAQISAEQLNIQPFHGVVEVVQNADDAKASELRLALRTGSRGRDLLFVHDGEPVRLPNLVAMALAFVSTKRDDASTKGRFGIGLKTLRALGDELTVHCGPYDASIGGNRVAPTLPARAIEGFFRPEAGETLLQLRVRPSFDDEAFRSWLSEWDASSLLFLDTVRAVDLYSLRSRKVLTEVRLEEHKLGTLPLELERQTLDCKETSLSDGSTGRSWRRYVVERPVPASAPKRSHKAIGKTTPLALAIPDQPGEDAGRLFAGLPLGGIGLGVPFSASAQFNVDTPRTVAQHDDLNGWLLDRIIELVVAVARYRFASSPATGWTALPLVAEAEGIIDRWLRERLVAGARAVQRRVSRGLAFEIDGATRRVGDLVYEAKSLERLLDADDLTVLYPKLAPLPRPLRDRDGRWRAVLAELETAREVDAEDALRLLDFADEETARRPVSWFIRFARAVITAEEGDGLLRRRSIVLSDGTRIVPPAPDVGAEVLVRSARPGSLAARLGLARVIHPDYLSENPEAAAVRRWLEASNTLVDDVGVEPTLRALAQRGARADCPPIELNDADLTILRDEIATLDDKDRAELGPAIGHAIRVRGFHWERGKRVRVAVTPAGAYIPAGLEDRSDGWAKAAGMSPGLEWIEARYANVLRREPADRRRPGALAFFRSLGAEVAPRLIEPPLFDTRHGDPASPIDFARLTPSQRDPLAGQYATHLKREFLSPDLSRVVLDISRERARQRRRERGRALLLALERDWARLYDGHGEATAVYSDHVWCPTMPLPATWLAVAMDTPWLTTEAGVPACPRELYVRTPSTEALYGRDRTDFAADVSQEEASSPALRALGLKTDPRVSEIIEQLSKLEASGDTVDSGEVAVRYAALAAAIGNVDMPLDGTIGDLSLRQLRARFGADRRKPGLIFVDGQWLPPTKVMRGKAIFGQRRAFVPSRSHADRLWRVLGIPEPTLTDCIRVLNEIATAPPTDEDDQILLDTYVYMAERLPAATRSERRAISELPLWSGQTWLTARPIYLADDAEVADYLTTKLPVWHPPLSPQSAGQLAGPLGVTLLNDDDFVPKVAEAERVAGEAVRDIFAAAVAHLQERLARNDPQLYRGLDRWADLADAAIALAPNLELELRLSGRRPIPVPARAHLLRSPLQISFADIEDAGADDAGGRAVAALFATGDRDKVGLAWAWAWARARSGDRSARRRLAQDQEGDDSMAALYEQAATKPKTTTHAKPAKRASANATQTVSSKPSTAPVAEVVRRLKSPDALIVSFVSRPDGGAPDRRRPGPRGLKSEKPAGRPIDLGARPAPRSAPLAYSPLEQEHLALVALQRAINGELSDLTDFRHLQGVGADAFDRLGRAFEIKSFATTMPDQVTLTANEFERALIDGHKYHLAVVAGLEQGYETIVRIVADPVHTLQVQKSTAIVLGGVLTATKPIEVRFSTDPGSDAPSDI